MTELRDKHDRERIDTILRLAARVDTLEAALQAAYDFLQDKAFMVDSDTHRCTKICEQLEAALRTTPPLGVREPVASAKCDCDIGMCTHRANCRAAPPSGETVIREFPLDAGLQNLAFPKDQKS